MKLRILSDLHLEFGMLELRAAGEDIIVLAGDVGLYTQGIVWADRLSQRLERPVVMVAGNHEFYSDRDGPRRTVKDTLDALHQIAQWTSGRVTFLESEAAVIQGVRFIGTTLWTDFALLGDPTLALFTAEQSMSDYRMIYRNPENLIRPLEVARTHFAYRKVIADALAEPFPGPTVIVTHHAPSPRSLEGRYADDRFAPAYASGLDDFVAQSSAALWVHGHIHVSSDYRIGDTRVICNPRGYEGYETNPEFDPNLLIEV